MSEVQNFLTAVTTGSFTLLGIFLGYWMKFRHEKWQYRILKEDKRKEIDENTKKSYLSPLCYYLTKNNMASIEALPLAKISYEEWASELEDFQMLQGNIKQIEKLMESNMDVLPNDLNLDLIIYVGTYNTTVEGFQNLITIIKKADLKEKQMEAPRELYEGTRKIMTVFEDMTAMISAAIYGYMKFNTSPNRLPVFKKAIEIGEIGKEIATNALKSLEQNADTTKKQK